MEKLASDLLLGLKLVQLEILSKIIHKFTFWEVGEIEVKVLEPWRVKRISELGAPRKYICVNRRQERRARSRSWHSTFAQVRWISEIVGFERFHLKRLCSNEHWVINTHSRRLFFLRNNENEKNTSAWKIPLSYTNAHNFRRPVNGLRAHHLFPEVKTKLWTNLWKNSLNNKDFWPAYSGSWNKRRT